MTRIKLMMNYHEKSFSSPVSNFSAENETALGARENLIYSNESKLV